METAQRNSEIIAAVMRGETQREIAPRYGLCGSAVGYIARRQGVNSRRLLTSDEIASIVAQYKRGTPIAHIESNRSRFAVARVVVRAGLHKPSRKSPAWTAKADAALTRMWGKHRCAAIAAILGTTKNAVIGRAYRLGLPNLQRSADAR